MRLWHESLITKLPRQQLLGQHRECCALRGGGWGKRHATVDYVFIYSPYKLFRYHKLVMTEMLNRGYKPNENWLNPLYRGNNMIPYKSLPIEVSTYSIYPEHDHNYLIECIENLRKNVLKSSLEEINEYTHFVITYIKIKKGRSIAGVQFHIEKKRTSLHCLIRRTIRNIKRIRLNKSKNGKIYLTKQSKASIRPCWEKTS